MHNVIVYLLLTFSGTLLLASDKRDLSPSRQPVLSDDEAAPKYYFSGSDEGTPRLHKRDPKSFTFHRMDPHLYDSSPELRVRSISKDPQPAKPALVTDTQNPGSNNKPEDLRREVIDPATILWQMAHRKQTTDPSTMSQNGTWCEHHTRDTTCHWCSPSTCDASQAFLDVPEFR